MARQLYDYRFVQFDFPDDGKIQPIHTADCCQYGNLLLTLQMEAMTTERENCIQEDNNAEMLSVVDEQGNVVGRATRGECHDGSKRLHAVVHLHVFDEHGRLYLQKRPRWKLIQPDKWDTAVGGHVAYGEPIHEALRRETSEELGLQNFTAEHLLTYVFESDRERELVYVYRTVTSEPITPSSELDGGRFFTNEEIREAIAQGVVTPNFIHETCRLGWS